MRALGLVCVICLLSWVKTARASSCDELVRSARAHETSGEPERALRQYHDAVTLDATCGAAWLGLGALRAQMGDAAEAERVFDAALLHVPSLSDAIAARARTRWALGRQQDAEEDMRSYIDKVAVASPAAAVRALEELAGWYRHIGQSPAELVCWRRIVVLVDPNDAAVVAHARAMTAALALVVATADPVTHPARRDLLRSAAAFSARGSSNLR